MIIGAIILFSILGIILWIVTAVTDEFTPFIIGVVFFLIAIIISIYGGFHGFINYPQTEGTHVGIITAIDLEGVYFRRYEVYLKSDGFESNNGTVSNETKYLAYEYEKELAEELKRYIGKKVKITYGHDGGYIGWNSCGTYHIKSIELLEEE